MKLKKISLKKNQDQLSDSDMKQIRGGASVSSWCGSGQYLYTCYTSFPSGANTKGDICASTSNEAKSKIKGNLGGSGFGEKELENITINCE
ncbi:TIGR04149 family rSAM-modified RiPP [Bacteroides sp. 519]|uniref:TIGR04149 family rSAM-modified RiPP n=1 Tax=Bacteroides sp. 519 TaxID=2302937 RepID=UPI0013D2E32F|nr:TIGR04149 family rSAM-modified RiPP [Bacteroides sp. 519]NDV57811.1 rSAM-modified peptide [Bacteroides sp. 519]